MYHILCVDDNRDYLTGLKTLLQTKYQVSLGYDADSCFQILIKENVDLVLLDVSIGSEGDGIELIKKIKELDDKIIIIMLSAYKDPLLIVEAIRTGATDYLCKTYPNAELFSVLEKNLNKRNIIERNAAYIELYNSEQSRDCLLVGKSEPIKKLIERAQRLKGRDTTILIEGESGTGKEVLAKYIHALEKNPRRPFIAVNCAAIPETLIESELFGHERGAFTGATQRRIGKFELASGGDIFLDEINSLKPEIQVKLLRVLQEKSFYRLGGAQPIEVKVRVIAASNANLEELVSRGDFRSDLMYRLRVISLEIPPLRKRLDDMTMLMDHFSKKYFPDRKIGFTREVMDIFATYAWPGNIRELENLIQSMAIMCTENCVTINDLPDWMTMKKQGSSHKANALDGNFNSLPALTHSQVEMSLKDYARVMEVEFIKRTLAAHDGNVPQAAKSLKISRSKLYWTLAQDPRVKNESSTLNS